jgi:FkbM family methyltransferase
MTKHVAFAHDFFRSPLLGQWDAEINTRWLHGLLAPMIKSIGVDTSPQTEKGSSPDIRVAEYLKKKRLKPNLATWMRLYSGNESVDSIYEPLRRFDFVVGFELSPSQLRFLSANKIRFLDLTIDPIRFAGDLFFSARTNDPTVQALLRDGEIPDNALLPEVAVMRSQLDRTIAARGEKFSRSVNRTKATLFVAQSDVDASRIVNGRLAAAADHLDTILGAIPKKGILLIKPHPFGVLHEDVHALHGAINGAVVIDDNIYTLLNSPMVANVVTLSSSVAAEAPLFGKRTIQLVEPDQEPKRLGVRTASRRYRIASDMLDPEFWAQALLAQPGRSVPLRRDTNAGRLRRSLGETWGYTAAAVPLKERTAKPGEKIEFRRGQRGTSLLAFGWHSPEDWGTWSSGKLATLLISPEPTSETLLFRLNVIAFVPNPAYPLRIAITSRGARIAQSTEVILQDSKDCQIEFLLSPARGKVSDLTEIIFAIEGAKSPSEIDISGEDTRSLGVGVRSLELIKVEDLRNSEWQRGAAGRGKKVRFKMGNILETQTRYGKMKIFSHDIGGVGKSLVAYGEWAEHEIAFLHYFLGLGSSVIDIGAFIGTHTLAFSRFVGARGRVYSIEPQPVFYDILKSNITLNKCKNVSTINAAVNSITGSMVIKDFDISTDKNFGGNALGDQLARNIPATNTSNASQIISLVTLDSLNLKRCDLIKIDAEGMESAIIAGGDRLLRQEKPIIYAECNSIESGVNTLSILRTIGYQVYMHVVESYNKNNYNANGENIFGNCKEAALVGVPTEKLLLIEQYQTREYEKLFRVDAVDDLALGMLFKPQYEAEVLNLTNASKVGVVNAPREAAWAQRQSEIANLQIELQQKASEREQSRVEMMQRQAEIIRLQTELLQRAPERDQLRDALAHLQIETARLDAALLQRTSERDQLRDALEGELEVERQRTAEASARSTNLAQQLDAHQKQLAEAATQTATLASDIEAERQRTAEASARSTNLAQQLEAHQKQLAEATTQSATLASELEAERQRTAEASARSTSLAQQLETHQKQLTEAATQTATLENELETERQRTAEVASLAASLDDELEFERRRAERAVTRSIALTDDLKAERRHATDMAAKSASYAEQLEAERRNAMKAAGRSARLIDELEARHASEAEQSKNELIWERSERNRLVAELQQQGSHIEQLAESLAQKEAEAARLETELRQQVSAREQVYDNLTQQRLENELVLYTLGGTAGSVWGHTSVLRRSTRVFRRLRWYLKYHFWRIALQLFGWATPRPLKQRIERRIKLLHGARIIETSNIFNPTWYLSHYPDVRAMGADPLWHYLGPGAAEGRDPCPMFDSDWYLAQNPDVHEAGTNPLVHYIEYGAAEGRDPCPMFDSDWYLAQNADVRATGMNPLAHYLRHGAVERRNHFFAGDVGKKSITIEQDGSATYRIENLATEINRQNFAGKRLVICVTHELPWPSQAGNQYRIARILDWLAHKGYELLVVVVPMGDAPLSDKYREAAFKKYSNIAICYSHGLVQTSFKTLDISVDSLQGRLVRDVFGECKFLGNKKFPLHMLEQNCCHETLIGLITKIAAQYPDAIYYLVYGFMSRLLDYLPHKAISFVDTLDVFSEKAKKVHEYGIHGEALMTEAEESRILKRADAVLAIHDGDARTLSSIIPKRAVLTVGVDFACVDVGPPSASPVILMVANDNALNTKGIHDFLRFAWPAVKSAVPDVKFIAVGLIGKVVRTDDPQVVLAGVVDSLTPYYKQARVVINPSVAGTGLKIKTVESIAHMRPIVTWPHGVDGIGEPLIRLCHVAENWYEFSQEVIALLANKEDGADQAADRLTIRAGLQADVVYRELESWLAECNGLTPAIEASST